MFKSGALTPFRMGLVLASVLWAAVGVVWLSRSEVEPPPSVGAAATEDVAPASSPLDRHINRAALRVRRVNSVKVLIGTSTEFPEGRMPIVGRGAFDMRSKLGRLTMDIHHLDEFSNEGEVGDIEARYDFNEDLVVYMKWPYMTEQIDPSISWLKLDMQEVAKEAGIDLRALLQMEHVTNPLQSFDYLAGIREVTLIERDTNGGVETERYSGVLEFEALADDLGVNAAASMRTIIDLSGIERVPIDVRLDRDGLPRSIHYGFSRVDVFGSSAIAPMADMRIDVLDYDVPVDIKLPDPAKVTDFMEFISTTKQSPVGRARNRFLAPTSWHERLLCGWLSWFRVHPETENCRIPPSPTSWGEDSGAVELSPSSTD